MDDRVSELALTVPAELLDVIVERVSAVVLERLREEIGASPWMTRAAAAEYLGLPVSRLEKDRTIPRHKDGGRVVYHRAELDAHFLGLGPEG